MAKQFVITPSPHLKTKEDIGAIMRAVCLALAPAFIFALYRFGYWSIAVTAIAVVTAVVTEAICQRLRHVPYTVDDYSAVVTGLLLAAVLPPNVAWYVPFVGSIVAIGIAKHCFGGLGCNIWNPALMGRAFLQAAFPTEINSGTWPAAKGESLLTSIYTNINGSFDFLVESAKQVGADVITSATPLEQLTRVVDVAGKVEIPGAIYVQNGVIQVSNSQIFDVFMGNTFGCIGEISALALLLGGIYLLGKKIITWHIPFAYIATVALLGWILPAPYSNGEATAYTAWFTGPWLMHVVGGGLFIGAFFMATDMVTSPMSRLGKLLFGCGCGLLTIVIRIYGGYPEGVCYSILLMNTVVPMIDCWTRPRVYGTAKASCPKH
ncbi:MAG: RnfABCDGE type electron transport complex subunit D [Planctomycetes bacterium]|nr:RnfABCDGE type electron transport complex subunit D [Planctomycetota bacterium]